MLMRRPKGKAEGWAKNILPTRLIVRYAKAKMNRSRLRSSVGLMITPSRQKEKGQRRGQSQSLLLTLTPKGKTQGWA